MWKVSVRKCTQVTCHQTQQAGARRKAWQGEKVSGLWKMWNKIQIKVWIDRHVKTHEKKPSHENQVKKVKSAAGFGIFVREKSVRVSDKYLWNECSKTFNSAFSLKRHMVSGLHKQKPKKKKSRTTVMRRVRKFLSESENLKEINRQRKSSDTSGLIDATLIEEIMAQILQLISEAKEEREIARMASLELPHAGNWARSTRSSEVELLIWNRSSWNLTHFKGRT